MSGQRFGARTKARSQALQLLFQAEATGRLVSDVLADDYALDDDSWPLDDYGAKLALGADGLIHELDGVIDDAAVNWSVRRMVSVDRNLLRLAIYEMACVDDVAVPVTINEFVELAKAYGTDESSRFVNGLLGKVARRIEKGESLWGPGAAQSVPQAEDAQPDAAPEAGEQGTDTDAAGAAGVESAEPAPQMEAADTAATEPIEAAEATEGHEAAADAGTDADEVDAPSPDASADVDAAGAVEAASGDDEADLPEWARG